MYPFSQSVNPELRSHLDAQVAYFNDISKSFSRSFQNLVQLNLQLGQTLLEDTSIAGQRLLTTDRPTEIISALASRAQPSTEKLRAYQQHISRVAADTQVDLARVTQEHVKNTADTARVLAEKVVRNATEETQRSLKQQQETAKNFSDPFQVQSDRTEASRGQAQDADKGSASGSVEFDGPAGHASFQGSVQGAGAVQNPAQSGGRKSS